ncbi:MAG: hypothetical protein PHD11_07210 [Bacteroidales bacterium]|jgi:hypothetical protein|nr:hypothetical protein [Bacteroidales bacterium]MDD4671013.1 hypothetical protein [Bacteroidales bacterium]
MTNISPKKRAVVSYENMSLELQDAFKEKYPHGYLDYMGDLFKVEKPDGSFFYAVSLEVPDAIYLIKIKVRIEDYEDIENGLFKDNTDEDVSSADDEDFPASDEDFAAAEAAAEEGPDE